MADIGTLLTLWIVALALTGISVWLTFIMPFGRIQIGLWIATAITWFFVGFDTILNYVKNNTDVQIVLGGIVLAIILFAPKRKVQPSTQVKNTKN
jgi:hypothetical protein